MFNYFIQSYITLQILMWSIRRHLYVICAILY